MTELNKIIIFMIFLLIIFFAYCGFSNKNIEPYVVFGRYRRYVDPTYYNYGKYNPKWYADDHPEPTPPKRVYIMPHPYYHY